MSLQVREGVGVRSSAKSNHRPDVERLKQNGMEIQASRITIASKVLGRCASSPFEVIPISCPYRAWEAAMKAARVLVLVMAVVVPLMGGVSDESVSRVQPFAASPRSASWEGLAIVVNRRNPIANVSLPQLRQMLFGERRWWPSGRHVTLVAMRRGSAERQTVLRVIYKMDDKDLDKYFLLEEFRGEVSSSPTTVQSPKDVRKFVSTTAGAVGYLRASDIDSSVKVLRINGLLPEDDGYPLRLRARSSR
jgi:hypothetical protein